MANRLSRSLSRSSGASSTPANQTPSTHLACPLEVRSHARAEGGPRPAFLKERCVVKVLGFGSSDDRFVGRLTRAAVHSFAALWRHGAVRPQKTGSVKGSATPEGGHCSGRAGVLLSSESSHAAAFSGSGPALATSSDNATGSLSMLTVDRVSPASFIRPITDRRRCRSIPTYSRDTAGLPLSWVGEQPEHCARDTHRERRPRSSWDQERTEPPDPPLSQSPCSPDTSSLLIPRQRRPGDCRSQQGEPVTGRAPSPPDQPYQPSCRRAEFLGPCIAAGDT